nr:Ig-like domain-containing protein [Gemmatimonadaceae bacterium]
MTGALRRAVGGALVAVALAACSGGEGTGLPRPATVEVQAPQSQLFVGQSVQLSARALDAGGGEIAAGDAEWASNNPQVVQVTTTGLLTAVAPGAAQVRAVINGRAGTMDITSHARPQRGLPGNGTRDANADPDHEQRDRRASLRHRGRLRLRLHAPS